MRAVVLACKYCRSKEKLHLFSSRNTHNAFTYLVCIVGNFRAVLMFAFFEDRNREFFGVNWASVEERKLTRKRDNKTGEIK